MKKKIINTIGIIIGIIIVFFLINSCIYNYKSTKIFEEKFNNNNFYGEYSNGQYNKNHIYGYKIAVQISKNSKVKSFDNKGYNSLINLLEAKYGYKVELDEYSSGDSAITCLTKNKAIILIAPKYSKEEIVYFLTTPQIVFKKLATNNNWQDTGINSRYIKKAYVTTINNNWGVGIEFDKIGTKNLAELTKELIGQNLGIFYAERLIVAPKITEPIENGRVIITAPNKGFTQEEAEQIANNINNRLDLDVLEIKQNIK